MPDKQDIKMETFTLGTIICRFYVPSDVIDEINNDYDNAIINFRKAMELNPFKDACNNKVRSIMIAHILFPELDPDNPATLSKKITTDNLFVLDQLLSNNFELMQ